MADKKIEIHIAANANLAALREVNSELAKMAVDVGRKNGDLRQTALLAAREYYNLGDASEKATSRAVLSAKEIEAAWRKAMAKPVEEADNRFKSLETVAKGALKGIGGAASSVFEMFLQGGIWGAAAEVITRRSHGHGTRYKRRPNKPQNAPSAHSANR